MVCLIDDMAFASKIFLSLMKIIFMEVTEKYVWSKCLEIQSQDVDSNSLLKIYSFMCMAQEAAHQHATSLGFGYEVLLKKNLIWVLSRFKAKVSRMPHWQEKVILKTWHKGENGIFYLRDYELLSEKGEILVAATSSWLIVDINIRKISRANDVLKELGALESETYKDALSPFVKKILIPEGLSLSYDKKVSYSDIDMNGHVNNARYSEWIIDALSLQLDFFHTPKRIQNFELCLNNEAHLDETVSIFLTNEGSNYYIVGKENDKVIFQSHIENE